MIKIILKLLLLVTLVLPSLVQADDADSDLYYASAKAFERNSHFEARLGAGYDFSNPYLNVFSLQAGGYWLAMRNLAIGLEGTTFFSSKRGSTETLQANLGNNGLLLNVNAPQYRFNVAFRATPVTGLVNLFGSKIIKAEMSVIMRGGVIQYQSVAMGPMVGFGLETQLGITPQFGIFTGISFDLEKPGSTAWQGRTGFVLGPSYRF